MMDNRELLKQIVLGIFCVIVGSLIGYKIGNSWNEIGTSWKEVEQKLQIEKIQNLNDSTCYLHAETCNGLDDDCDGTIDNHSQTDGEICGLDECGEMVMICSQEQMNCESQCQPSISQ